MRSSLALVLALVRLRLRLHRHNGFWLLAYGVLLPGSLSLWAQAHATTAEFSQHVIIGTFVLGIHMLIAKRAAHSVSAERMQGMWALLATTRVTRREYLAAQLIDLLALVTVPMLGLVVAAFMYPNLTPKTALWLLPTVMSAFWCGATGIAIAARSSRQVAGLMVNVLVVSMLAFCPLLYPPARVPLDMRAVVDVLPPTVAVNAIVEAWSGAPASTGQLALLACWSIVALLLLVRVFPEMSTGHR
jgi:ABC-type multidrug transport system permease subunit